jgi:hypothetical protein
VRLVPDLNRLPPGHMVFTCTKTGVCLPGEKDGSVAAGSAAGHHYDPAATGKHEGPNGNGHLGDLPVLAVDERASAISAAITIRLKIEDLKGHSLMIHAVAIIIPTWPRREVGATPASPAASCRNRAARRILKQLDLIAVGVFHEGEHGRTPFHRPGVAHDLAATSADRLASRVHVIDADGDMPVGVSQLVSTGILIVHKL